MSKKVKNRLWKRTGLLFIIVVLLALVGGSIGIYHHYHYKNKNAAKAVLTSTQYSAAPPADNIPNNERKSSSTPSPTLNGNPTSSSSSQTVTVSINPVVNNGNVHVGTLVNGTTTGSCSLTAYQAGQATLQLGSSNVASDVNEYDCGVFNIATSKFPTSGTWSLTLTVSTDSTNASGSANITL